MKYILEYNEINENKNDKVFKHNALEFLKNYGNDKDRLSKYNLRSLSNQRNTKYQKIYHILRVRKNKLKESDDYIEVIDRIREIDSACSDFLYLLSEFRAGIIEFVKDDPKTIQKYVVTNKDYIKAHDKYVELYFRNNPDDIDESFDKIEETVIKDLFFEFRNKQKIYPKFTLSHDYLDRTILGQYDKSKDEITIFFARIFKKYELNTWIWGSDKNFNTKLQEISNTYCHEVIHRMQFYIDPNLMNIISAKKDNLTGIIGIDEDSRFKNYIAGSLEIEANAGETVRALLNMGYDYDAIKYNIKTNQPLDFPKWELYKELFFSTKDHNIWDKFNNAMISHLNKRNILKLDQYKK